MISLTIPQNMLYLKGFRYLSVSIYIACGLLELATDPIHECSSFAEWQTVEFAATPKAIIMWEISFRLFACRILRTFSAEM